MEYKAGAYQVRYEAPEWYEFFKGSDWTFHFTEGDKVHCFASVFAPAGMTIEIVHHWQFYSQGRWVTTDRIPYTVRGGVERGFRGSTRKQNLTDARKWRVNLETTDGRLLKRVEFDLVRVRRREQELVTAQR